jgi:hypothetical protein
MLVKEADNYTDASNKYVGILDEQLKGYTKDQLNTGDLLSFTSDYARYWFDYEGMFDLVLAEFGWNHSRLLNVALVRGASTFHNKDWGVTIAWKYNDPPYVESAQELYGDLVLAYQSGAKYTIVFSYPKVTAYGILEQEHLNL